MKTIKDIFVEGLENDKGVGKEFNLSYEKVQIEFI
jgi:hypothetical protein